MAIEIRKATRKKAKLRLGIAAPSGAGKTYSALLLAFGIGGKVGLIDTEHGSGDLYAHLGDYDIVSIEAPYTIPKYREALKAFEDAGYTTVIIDSLSHAWAGDGGLIDKQGKIADRGGNSYTAWRSITPEHNSLVEDMLSSPCHVIATMRSKQEYVLETNEKGKQTPKKVGMAPIQRDGMEYEFTVMFDIDIHHIANASKDRTSTFDGRYFKIEQDTGKDLLAWLETGTDVPAPVFRNNDAARNWLNGVLKKELPTLKDQKAHDAWVQTNIEKMSALPEDGVKFLQGKLDDLKKSFIPPQNVVGLPNGQISSKLENAERLAQA